MKQHIKQISELNLGDCEIDLISFIGSDLRLNLVDNYNNRIICINFRNVKKFIMETEFMQNVISEIVIKEELSLAIQAMEANSFLKKLNNLQPSDEANYVAYVRPVAGFEGLIFFDDADYSFI